ncbi:MAG: hypothetical protein ACXVI5_07295 [Halobacteriota archaeon]
MRPLISRTRKLVKTSHKAATWLPHLSISEPPIEAAQQLSALEADKLERDSVIERVDHAMLFSPSRASETTHPRSEERLLSRSKAMPLVLRPP